MASLYHHLVNEPNKLVKLLDPPFDKAAPNPGYIKGYLPGVRENGGQYTHAATHARQAKEFFYEDPSVARPEGCA